jgi:hypothetical protein
MLAIALVARRHSLVPEMRTTSFLDKTTRRITTIISFWRTLHATAEKMYTWPRKSICRTGYRGMKCEPSRRPAETGICFAIGSVRGRLLAVHMRTQLLQMLCYGR